MKDRIQLPRNHNTTTVVRTCTTALSLCFRLLLVLHFLRKHLQYGTLSILYKISKPTVSREITHMLPKVCLVLDFIHLPRQITPHPHFEGVTAAIDCTSHFRNRVHPKQADWYRWDKHAFFISAQVVVSLTGHILSVILVKGHNNDQGKRTHSMLRSIVEVVIGCVKLYLFTAQKVRLSPELHALGLMICYQLTQWKFIEFPLRVHIM